MKVLWFVSGLLPEACKALGRPAAASCGWLPSMLNALRTCDPNMTFCVVGVESERIDVTVGAVRYVTIGKSGGFTYKNIPQWLQKEARTIIADFDPDVIHVQGTEYFYGHMDPWVYGDKPVVVSIQGIISGYYPHVNGELTPSEVRWTKFNLRGLLKGQSIFNEQKAWRLTRTQQEAAVFRAQKNFIGRTEWDEAWTHYYNPTARYFHVDENLREPFFVMRRTASTVVRHRLYCGASASYPLKAAHWLLRAVAALVAEFPDIQLRIAASESALSPSRSFMARLKGQAYHAYLRRLIRQLGIEKNVIALPSLSAAQVAEELQRAELFVLPSMCENSPNSLGEAMLVGTPSIATFVGGVPSILKDGVEGKLVPSGDPAAVAGAIRRWFLHPEEAEAEVEAARQTALKRHDALQNAKRTIEVYRSLTREERL